MESPNLVAIDEANARGNSVARVDGETYEEYIKRVVGDKGVAAWDGFTDSERIVFLSETLSQHSVILQKLCDDMNLLIQAHNIINKQVSAMGKNRFGVLNQKR